LDRNTLLEHPAGETDSELLRRLINGDGSAFTQFMNRYRSPIGRYVHSRVRDRHQAEDITQEVFLRVLRAAQSSPHAGRASVKTWLFTIANNCMADHFRLKVRKPLALVNDKDDPPEPAATDHTERIASDDQTEFLLDLLPDEQRQAVAMKIIGGLTLAEIAEVLGCPLGTVKSRLLYGLNKIHEHLTRKGGVR